MNTFNSQYIYRTQPIRSALLTEGPTPEDAQTPEIAQRLMENDPAVQHSVMRAELFPYRIAVLSDQIIHANKQLPDLNRE